MYSKGINFDGCSMQKELGRGPANQHEPDLQSNASQSDLPSLTNNPSVRKQYLQALEECRMPVVLGVAGITQAGKSTITSALVDEHGFTQAIKLLPRPLRSNEDEGYRPWVSAEIAQRVGGENVNLPANFDTTPPKEILLADSAFSGVYAISARDIATKFLNGETTAAILGRAEENYLLHEGAREAIPLIPVGLIQLEVPLKILRERAMGGNVIASAELSKRLQAMEDFELGDQRQMAALAMTIPITTVMNVTPAEVARFRLIDGQIKPLTKEDIASLVETLGQEILNDSATYARDLLRPRRLDYGNASIPDAVVDVLENQFQPLMYRNCVTPYMCGGLGVALYMMGDGLTSRPVSPDIDFIVETEKGQSPESISGEDRLLAALADLDCPHQEIKDGGWNHQYLTRQAKTEVFSSAATGNTKVELDCLVAIRLIPNSSKFCFELPLDQHAKFFHREVALPNGEKVYLAPPEHLLADKLIMGRGQDIGKFDLFDCAGLLSRGPIDISLLRRLVDYQRYNPELDKPMRDLLAANSSISLEDLCSYLQVQDPRVKNAIIWADGQFVPTAESSVAARLLTADGLKRFAMVNRLINSLNRIVADDDAQYSVGNGNSVKISEAYDFGEVMKQANRAKEFLLYYLEFILDRGDLYVMHPAADTSTSQGYFRQLEKQTRSLLGLKS